MIENMEDLQYTIIRSGRKTVALILQPDGSLLVRAPTRMPARDIAAFVDARSAWVVQTLARMAALPPPPAPLVIKTGAVLPWLGETLTLSVGPYPKCKQDGAQLFLPEQSPAKALETWCRREARAHLTERVAHFSTLMGVCSTGLKITGATTRWGSCTGRNSLNFTFRLLHCPPELVDYVVVHELAHIRQKNHSPAFWAVVEGAMPDYPARQAALKARQGVMNLIEKE